MLKTKTIKINQPCDTTNIGGPIDLPSTRRITRDCRITRHHVYHILEPGLQPMRGSMFPLIYLIPTSFNIPQCVSFKVQLSHWNQRTHSPKAWQCILKISDFWKTFRKVFAQEGLTYWKSSSGRFSSTF